MLAGTLTMALGILPIILVASSAPDRGRNPRVLLVGLPGLFVSGAILWIVGRRVGPGHTLYDIPIQHWSYFAVGADLWLYLMAEGGSQLGVDGLITIPAAFIGMLLWGVVVYCIAQRHARRRSARLRQTV